MWKITIELVVCLCEMTQRESLFSTSQYTLLLLAYDIGLKLPIGLDQTVWSKLYVLVILI